MQIRNVTRDILEGALAEVNERFNDNIEWKRIERNGRTREGGEVWLVTLKAKDRMTRFDQAYCDPYTPTRRGCGRIPCRLNCEYRAERANKGVRRGFPWGGKEARHFAAACWHVHGVLFDSLPNHLHIRESGGPCYVPHCADPSPRAEVTIRTGAFTVRPGDPWNDRQIGSVMQPLYSSEACDCDARDWEGKEQRLDEGRYVNAMS